MFIEYPATQMSLALRKPVFGVGVNDAVYMVSHYEGGKKVLCPFYQRWASMITRCYSVKYQEKRPTYKGCAVCQEWLTFSNFRSWMEFQDWEGCALDKDLLVHGNKIYSPEFCVFVPVSLNSLLVDCAAARGEYPQGVCFHKREGKFRVQCRVNGKNQHLGSYATPEAASQVYKKFKSELIIKTAHQYKNNEMLYIGLLKYAQEMLN